MNETGFFDYYFFNKYGSSAEDMEKLAKNFGKERLCLVLDVINDTKYLDDTLKRYLALPYDDYSLYKLTKISLVWGEMVDIDWKDYDIEESFARNEDDWFIFDNGFIPTLYVQKEIDSDVAKQIEKICEKAEVEVKYEKYEYEEPFDY